MSCPIADIGELTLSIPYRPLVYLDANGCNGRQAVAFNDAWVTGNGTMQPEEPAKASVRTSKATFRKLLGIR